MGTNTPGAKSDDVTANTFQAFDIHQGRLVWDPVVHRAYNEHCYYFLLRLRDPEIDVVGTIQGLLVQSKVESSCIYILYGYYDVLVRLWATDQKRGRFVKRLDEHRELIEDVKEFQAHKIEYLWATKPATVDDSSFPRYRPQVESVAKAIRLGNGVSDSTINELAAAGLVHRIAQREKTGIKFYIALSRIPGPIESKVDLDRLKETLQQKNLPLNDVSVYSGIGFCNYFIKAVVGSYPEIVSATMVIFRDVRKLNLRPMTLLIANNDAPESDQIDLVWEELSVDLLQLGLLLGPGAERLISQLESHDRTEVGKVFGENCGFLGSPFESVFRALLVSRLQNDGELLGEKLAFLMRLEGLLRRFFVEVCTSAIGEKTSWFKIVQDAAGRSSVDPAKNPAKEYTLHDLLTVMDKLIAEGTLSQEAVETVLGTGWKRNLDQVKDLRNAFAHGKLYEPGQLKKLVETGWYSFARTICNVGSIYNSLVLRYTEKV